MRIILAAGLLMTLCCMPITAVTIVDGVSWELAQYRSAHISDVSYSLAFTVPEEKSKPVYFEETILFDWTGEEDLQIDFQGTASQLSRELMVNDKTVKTVLVNEHIIIPAQFLVQGENSVALIGYSGDKALNRSDEYMYTLFVPDHARSVFPCFDQPDLKAVFSLNLDIPKGWLSISNQTSKPIPTYLFSFTAGKFKVKYDFRDGRLLTALYRETDSAKVAQLPIVFDQVALSLRWMEDYTGIPYPFENYGFVMLPGYQFGGMEHPGCIQYNDQRIFLGPEPTPDEEMSRLNLIAHETAHMWFGDLVTMRWFDDVWTKEVFANFMADKIAREQFPDANHDLAFIKAHYPAAMNVDRTSGTHPIQQPLDNMNKAGLLYGNIIYHKAPIMMSKLEKEKGERNLRDGLRSYLNRYAYGNATWDDQIVELDRFAPEHSAQSFSDVWVKQKGMPTYECQMTEDGDLDITQQDPWGRGLVWNQTFDICLDAAGTICELYNMGNHDTVKVPQGSIPVVNYHGEGYGRFALDERQLTFLLDTWHNYDKLERYSALLTLFENYHLGNLEAETLFRSLCQGLAQEHDDLVASTMCGILGTLMTRLEAPALAEAETRLLDLARSHNLPSVRQSLMRLLSVKAVSLGVIDSLYAMWKQRTAPSFGHRDYMRMAYHLALMLPDRWKEILAVQRERLTNDDERREFDFISRACNPDEQAQQQLFNDLLMAENRRVEPWARDMLALLNDPTREPFSNRYLTAGLDALEEIQRTGDIFFPGYWLSSLLSGHKSDEARQIVKAWIDAHPTLEPALMNKLKENAYWLISFLQM
ncbi:MAG: ERAP1-like C-terminal domain-containing protein [Muribaculaceae bacterium]|nr:ERAP1-like C-terminal domain-containing protein [Muribaculaceae bacterium]